ncbi:MAG: glycosyltransferase [Acidobacteriota bacterium]
MKKITIGNMKILSIILDGRIAGPQLRILEVAKILKDRNKTETVVVAPKKDFKEFRDVLTTNKIEFHSIDLHRLSKSLVSIFKWFIFFPVEVKKIKKIIETENPDVVHCTGSWQWKGVVAASQMKKPILWHLNDTNSQFFVKFFFKWLAKKADSFLVEGKKVHDYYLKKLKMNQPVFNVQAPVDVARFDPKKITPDEKIGSGNNLKIVTVGNINPCKGIEYFIDTAGILTKKYKNLSFYIVGNLFVSQKDYINLLKKKIKRYNLNNISFYGFTENIPSVLKSTDIYVCSSVTEASPQSVWEAMAMERAIVSTDVGSVSDFIKDGENGFIVNIEDSESLAEKIGLLINDPKKRVEFGKNARVVAEKELDVKIIAKKHFEIYESLIS